MSYAVQMPARHDSSAQDLRLLVDSIPGLVATFTPAGDVEFVNRQVLEYFGRSLEQLRHWDAGTTHPDDGSRVVDNFRRSIVSGEPFEFEARARRFDGVYRWFQVRGLPYRDSEGVMLRWYVLLTDIHDLEARSELAHVARDAAMNTLTASIAHDINQPLSGIITNAGTCLRMLDASPPNLEGARETVRRTVRDANRASDVTTRVRALFSTRELNLEQLDMNDLTRDVVALSRNDLQRNRIVLQSELADDLPAITGDRDQLQQVVLNLLRNASDAMATVDDRARHLLIRTARDAGDSVRVIVKDAGVGLDVASMNRLFDPFYTTKTGGKGIGLSVSRSIIQRHHGRLWAEPNDGPGATFSFSIPKTPATPDT